MAAMIINIIIPAEQEEEFNTAVSEGTLRVGRYLYDVDESMENVTVTDDEESLTDSSKEQDYSGVTGTTEAMEETTASDEILKMRRRWEREVSLDYLMSEKFVQLAEPE